MTDYKNGKIYKIVCKETGKVYIGSTKKSLNRRLQEHKQDYKRYCEEKKNYITSFEIFKKNNYEIVLIEEYPCDSRQQLETRERYYIENCECINKTIPTRTKQEYCDENKAKIQEYKKEYNIQYRKENKEKIQEYKKQYREENKQKIQEYYEENKEKMSAKVECKLCGRTVSKNKLNRHRKSYICQDIYMNRQD